jgi:hypothetical protein
MTLHGGHDRLAADALEHVFIKVREPGVRLDGDELRRQLTPGTLRSQNERRLRGIKSE